jgi:hypothetical protein
MAVSFYGNCTFVRFSGVDCLGDVCTLDYRADIGQTLLFLVVNGLHGWRYPPPAPFSYFFLAFTSAR